ncbi:hypothetical protein IMCC9480_3050 [Oxalobacteraceae bacterium IMCC9480]|nr:hypothetical protein IMCC9480_3050 [Oxalobacteraceae bacterium IMCC9480]
MALSLAWAVMIRSCAAVMLPSTCALTALAALALAVLTPIDTRAPATPTVLLSAEPVAVADNVILPLADRMAALPTRTSSVGLTVEVALAPAPAPPMATATAVAMASVKTVSLAVLARSMAPLVELTVALSIVVLTLLETVLLDSETPIEAPPTEPASAPAPTRAVMLAASLALNAIRPSAVALPPRMKLAMVLWTVLNESAPAPANEAPSAPAAMDTAAATERATISAEALVDSPISPAELSTALSLYARTVLPISFLAMATPIDMALASAPLAIETAAAMVLAWMLPASVAPRLILPLPLVVMTEPPLTKASTVLVSVPIAEPPAPAAAVPLPPAAIAIAPPNDSVSMLAVSLAARTISWFCAVAVDAVMLARTVLPMVLVAVAKPIAPAAATPPPAILMATPPALDRIVEVSVAVRVRVPPLARTPLPPALLLLIVARTWLPIVFPEVAPAAATAPATTPAPTANAPPRLKLWMVAFSLAVRLTAPLEMTVAASIFASTRSWIVFLAIATPSDTAPPTMPAPSARLTPPASALMAALSVADSTTPPLTMVLTMLPLPITALTLLPILLPE